MRPGSLLLATVLLLFGTGRSRAESPEPDPMRSLICKSLDLLGTGARGHAERRECFSCHHQALPVMAVALAREHRLKTDETLLEQQVAHTAAFLEKNREAFAKGHGTGGGADTAGYALMTLKAGGRKPDATTDAVATYLLGKDDDRGFWPAHSNRPPTESSAFSTTFVAVAGLKHYGTAMKKKEIDARIGRVREWLWTTKPKDTEERVFRLHLLKLTDAPVGEFKSAVAELLKTQRADGGWGQTGEMESDAYATGTVLTALRQTGGLEARDPAAVKGRAYLIRTAREDGSWLVKSRSKPFQAYFETGFPHGKDQWISSAATAWAVMALILTAAP